MIAEGKQLAIDKDFQALCPPLSPEEANLLEASIESEGCREAIVVWRGLIVDGHNRYRICTRFKIAFETRELAVESRGDVINWIIACQLGRRNLTDEQKSYLRGKRFHVERKRVGKGGAWKVHEQNVLGNTDARLAKEYGVSDMTIKRDSRFALAVDAIEAKEGPEAKAKILSGNSGLSMTEVREGKSIADAKPVTLRSALRKQRAMEKAMSTGEILSGAISQHPTESIAGPKQVALADLFESIKRIASTVDAIAAQKDRWLSAVDREHWTSHTKLQIRSKLSALERDISTINKFLK